MNIELILFLIIIVQLTASYFRERGYVNQIRELTNKLMSRNFESYMQAQKSPSPINPPKINLEIDQEDDLGVLNSYIQ